MSRSRASALLVASVVALTAVPMGGPASAADSPIAAAEILVGKIESSAFDSLDEVVCAPEQDAVRLRFDIGEQLADAAGLDAEPYEDAISSSIADLAIELESEDGDEALVRLSGTLSRTIDGDVARRLARAMANAFGDEELSDEDLDELVPAMVASITAPLALDEELTILREDGEWLVCGGFGDSPIDDGSSGPGDLGPQVSFDGLCGLVTIDEVDSLGPLAYDSSFGEDDYCSYSSSDSETYHSLSADIDRTTSLEEYQSLYGEGEAVTVAGMAGFVLDDSVYLELPDGGTFVGSLFVDPESPVEVDVTAHLSAFAGLLLPVVSSTDLSVAADPLCSLLDLDALNALSPLQYAEIFDGGSGLCVYSSDVTEDGYHTLSVYRDVFTIEDLASIFPEGAASVVGGRPAYSDATTLWLDIGDGDGTVAIAPLFEDTQAAADMDHLVFAAQVGELLAAAADEEGTAHG